MDFIQYVRDPNAETLPTPDLSVAILTQAISGSKPFATVPVMPDVHAFIHVCNALALVVRTLSVDLRCDSADLLQLQNSASDRGRSRSPRRAVQGDLPREPEASDQGDAQNLANLMTDVAGQLDRVSDLLYTYTVFLEEDEEKRRVGETGHTPGTETISEEGVLDEVAMVADEYDASRPSSDM